MASFRPYWLRQPLALASLLRDRTVISFFAHPVAAVFVATGTGIAPFVSMARSGAEGFVLLHGVRTSADLYYERISRAAAGSYVPCLSRGSNVSSVRHEVFFGRVNEYIEGHLPQRRYDFYLSGRGEMIRDVTLLVDDLFPDSRVYSEIFF